MICVGSVWTLMPYTWFPYSRPVSMSACMMTVVVLSKVPTHVYCMGAVGFSLSCRWCHTLDHTVVGSPGTVLLYRAPINVTCSQPDRLCLVPVALSRKHSFKQTCVFIQAALMSLSVKGVINVCIQLLGGKREKDSLLREDQDGRQL